MNALMPLIITLVVSIVVGLCTLNSPLGFFGGFGISLVLHFVAGGIANTYIQYKGNIESERIINDRITEINKQTMKLTCPCDRGIEQTVPLFFNRANKYACTACNKLVSCQVTVRPTLVTDVFDLDDAQVKLINQMQDISKETDSNE